MICVVALLLFQHQQGFSLGIQTPTSLASESVHSCGDSLSNDYFSPDVPDSNMFLHPFVSSLTIFSMYMLTAYSNMSNRWRSKYTHFLIFTPPFICLSRKYTLAPMRKIKRRRKILLLPLAARPTAAAYFSQL